MNKPEAGKSMTDEQSPDVWFLIFEQTPPVLRWVLGFLTVGIFTLAGYLYKIHQAHVERIENQLNKRLDKTEASIYTRISGVEARFSESMDHTNRLLVEIARNTSTADRDK